MNENFLDRTKFPEIIEKERERERLKKRFTNGLIRTRAKINN